MQCILQVLLVFHYNADTAEHGVMCVNQKTHLNKDTGVFAAQAYLVP